MILPESNDRGRTGAPRLPGCAPSSCRAGMTLVELLVVMAVIGMLIALLLPAVQWAREAARRMQCGSQLKQLGLAVHMYHDIYRTMPISIGPWEHGPRPAPQRNGKGWIVGLLPHLEQQGLYDQFVPCFQGDFFTGYGIRAVACREVLRQRLSVLECPSDPSVQQTSRDQFELVGVESALTSYKGVIGDSRLEDSIHPGSMPDCHMHGGCNGLFSRVSYQQPLRLSDVLAGLSNTFMIGEDVAEQNYHSAAYYANGDWGSCHGPLNYFVRPPTPLDWPNVMTYRSRHPGGVHFCFADGSVRFVHEDIDHDLYRAHCNRRGAN